MRRPNHLLRCFVVYLAILQGSATIFQTVEELGTETFDFVVVGGGTAGNVVANRLSENPFWSVLVIEAGGPFDNETDLSIPSHAPRLAPNTPWDWNFTTTPQPALKNRTIPVTRGHVLGGSSSINYMGYTRGTADDFDRYAAITEDEGWSWDRLLPYIAKNERFAPPLNGNVTRLDPSVHSFTGINSVSLPEFPRFDIESRIMQSSQESEEFFFNRDMNSGNHLGFGWVQATINRGERSSSAASYLGPGFIERSNLNVLVNTRATRLTQASARNLSLTFDGVEITQDGGKTFRQVKANKEIILSAGPVMSPSLLLLSGIGDTDELAATGIQTLHHLSSVGKNVTEHPLLQAPFRINSNDSRDTETRDPVLAAQQLEQWKVNKTGPLVDPPLIMLGWFRLNETSEIFQRFPDPSSGNQSAHIEIIFVDRFGGPQLPAEGHFMTLGMACVSPLSIGSLSLNSSNPFDKPIINMNLLESDFDKLAMREAFRAVKRLLALPAWDGFLLDSGPTNATTDAELDEFIAENTATIFHLVGTAAMSPKGASWGVVDPDLRVKGVQGLRVVDSSVFPKIPTAHTQAPTYILAERAADLIKEAWFSRGDLAEER